MSALLYVLRGMKNTRRNEKLEMKYLLPKPVVDTFSLGKMQKRTRFYSRMPMPSRSFCGLGLFLGRGSPTSAPAGAGRGSKAGIRRNPGGDGAGRFFHQSGLPALVNYSMSISPRVYTIIIWVMPPVIELPAHLLIKIPLRLVLASRTHSAS